MSNSKVDIKPIKNKIIKGIIFQFLPLFILGIIEPFIKLNPVVTGSLSLFIVGTVIYGYIICWMAAHKYSIYKGYPGYLGIVFGILNIFGLAFLFLLKNKKLEVSTYSDNPFEEISILAIFISIISISILFIPLMIILISLIGNVSIKEAWDYLENKDISTILNIPLEIIWGWYIFKEINQTSLSFRKIAGSFKKINYKLPVGLAIAEYFFAWGFNSTTLYFLSFILPNYVENQINKNHVTTLLGFIAYAIGAVIFAPIMEEFLFRGIIFQKLTIKRNIIQGLLISAIIFMALHFRYDLVSLFLGGIIFAILYLKTKQLIVPIICHFFYNLMVVMRLLYHLLSDFDHSATITIAAYQQKFIDNLEWKILFIALSAPYLIYFIYKNFPRNYNLKTLPYFVNQQ